MSIEKKLNAEIINSEPDATDGALAPDDKEKLKYLQTALLAGEIALGNGAETARCEEVMQYILSDSGSKNYATSVISTSLFARVGRRSGLATIKKWDTDLNKVCMVNDVSRRLCAKEINIDEAALELEEIKRKDIYRFVFRLIAYVLTAAFLPVFLGGSFYDCVAGAICGVVMACANAFFRRVNIRYFIVILVQSIIMVLCTYLAAVVSHGAIDIDVVISASISPMLPGLALTNAVRDLLQGDYVSGAGRLLEAVVRSLSIVLGVVTGLMMCRHINVKEKVMASLDTGDAAFFLLLIVAAILTAAGYAIMMEVPPKYIIWAAVIGAFGRLAYMTFGSAGISDTISTLAATALITIFAQIASRVAKAPTILFLISGIMSLVPGSFLYASIRMLLSGDNSRGLEALTQTLMIAGAIALAIFLVDTVFNIITLAKKKQLIDK